MKIAEIEEVIAVLGDWTIKPASTNREVLLDFWGTKYWGHYEEGEQLWAFYDWFAEVEKNLDAIVKMFKEEGA